MTHFKSIRWELRTQGGWRTKMSGKFSKILDLYVPGVEKCQKNEEVPKCQKMGMKMSKISLIFHLHFPVILVLSFQHLSFLWHFGTEFSRSDISLTFWYWIFKIWHLSDISVSFSDILVLDPQGPIRKWADRIDVKILISKLVYILRFISEIRTRPALEN